MKKKIQTLQNIISRKLAPYSFFFFIKKRFCQFIKLRHWKKKYDTKAKEARFKTLFANENGFRLSKLARLQNDDLSLTYGEIDFLGFLLSLSKVTPLAEDVFYDLGSGLGKAVIATSLVYECKKHVGIECLEPLHNQACAIKKKLSEEEQSRVFFEHKNIIECDLEEATIVFCAATSFFGQVWQDVVTKLLELKIGTRVVILSKQLPKNHFTLIAQTITPTSWGVSKVFIYTRSKVLN